jgi:hypothetical protein
VRGIARELVGDYDGRRRSIEPVLDVVQAHDAVDRRDIKRAVVERDAHRPTETAGDSPDGGRTALLQRHRVDLAFERADEQSAVLAERHLARCGDARNKLDSESRR